MLLLAPEKVLLAASLLFSAVDAKNWCGHKKIPWGKTNVIGGQDGEEFCETKFEPGRKSPAIINGIEAWHDDKKITGIQFYFSNGDISDLYGQQTDKGDKIKWSADPKTIQQVRLWGNGKGKYLGRIQVTVEEKGKEKVFDVGKNTNGQDTFDIKTYSGLLVGAVGLASDKAINKLGLKFLRSPVASIVVKEPAWDKNIEELKKGADSAIKSITYDHAHHENKLSKKATWMFQTDETKERSTTWTTDITNAFGGTTKFEMEGKIFGIGSSGGVELRYDHTRMKGEAVSEKRTTRLWVKNEVELDPKGTAYCIAEVQTGEFEVEFTAKAQVTLEDKTKVTFMDKGKMRQVQWGEAASICQDKPFGADEWAKDKPRKPRAKGMKGETTTALAKTKGKSDDKKDDKKKDDNKKDDKKDDKKKDDKKDNKKDNDKGYKRSVRFRDALE